MYRKIIAVILLCFTSLSFAQPTSPSIPDMPDDYAEIIKRFSDKAKEIADNIPKDKRLLTADMFNKANLQKMKQCAKLATSQVKEERTAGLKCLNKGPSSKLPKQKKSSTQKSTSERNFYGY